LLSFLYNFRISCQNERFVFSRQTGYLTMKKKFSLSFLSQP
jgi:hypothetical protein